MRPAVDISRTAACAARYASVRSKLRCSPNVVDSLIPVFGTTVQSLPRSLRLELLAPELQALPTRSDFFAKLRELGLLTLQLRLNEYLGTQSIQIDENLIHAYARSNRLGYLLIASSRLNKTRSFHDDMTGSSVMAATLLMQCVGAVETMIGSAEGREMVNEHILAGKDGLASLYLETLSRAN